MTQNRFAPRLRPLVERYFGVIRDEDLDFMLSCYVNTREYNTTYNGVYGLIRDSLSPFFKKQDIRDFDDDESGGLFGRAVIRNIQRERKNQVIVLFGGKGSGKSTFLRRILLHKAPKYLEKRAIAAIVDLLDVPENSNIIEDQIWNLTIANLDQNHLIQGDRDTLLALFRDRYRVADRQVLAGLSKESEAYNVRLNDLIQRGYRIENIAPNESE